MIRRTRRGLHLGVADLRTTSPFRREPMFRASVRRRRRWPIVLLVLLLVAGAAGGWQLWRQWWSEQAQDRARLERTVGAYLRAWADARWMEMRGFVLSPPEDFVAAHDQMFDALRVTEAALEPGAIVEEGGAARVPFRATLELAGLGSWSYGSRLSLVRAGERWRVEWSPSTLHPRFHRGLSFARARTWPDRAPILAADGSPLTTEGDAVTVGVVPGRIENRPALLRALRRLAGADPRKVRAALGAPGVKPDWFVPVAVLPMYRYQQVRAELYPIPGVFFRRSRSRIPVEEGFAPHVVGRVAEATAEQLEELGPPYVPGDHVGQYGLERAFERRLAGLPSGTIELTNRQGNSVRLLHRFAGREPRRVKTFLSVPVQRAAERALEDTTQPAAIVAVDARTGQIRAVANAPTFGSNRALAGHYPPGSTFKVVTAAAVVAEGKRLAAPVPCPASVVVNGKTFRNFEGEALGTIPFLEAFAHSCNTAFIRVALDLPRGALVDMAETFGFRSGYRLPLALAATQFPRPRDDVELAASAIGQGRVLATPLHMASVAGAVANGAWRTPRLVATDPKAPPSGLPRGVAKGLRTMMRAVVTDGTGTAADVAGLEAAGKTGTAEYGSGGRTHAWFIGYRGPLAFAVVVEGGGVGGRVAAPIAARFLQNLPS